MTRAPIKHLTFGPPYIANSSQHQWMYVTNFSHLREKSVVVKKSLLVNGRIVVAVFYLDNVGGEKNCIVWWTVDVFIQNSFFHLQIEHVLEQTTNKIYYQYKTHAF